MVNAVAAQRMEDFAKTILSASPDVQKGIWENLESVLSPEEIHGLKVYVGLFHMLTDQSYYNAVKEAVGEQLYNDLHVTANPVSVHAAE